MNNFKKGDKIRIKDEVSSKTHRYEPPTFIDSMDRMKNKVLTIRDFTNVGNIKVEDSEFTLHPEWVTLVESDNFKKGDKIRIKDEVSSETHHGMPPHFTDSMDYLKDKVLTFSYYNLKGRINIEEEPWLLHPDWVTLAESDNFKIGDKIRIKDGVSSKTHRKMYPHFVEWMDGLKDKVLTFSYITPEGNIRVEDSAFSLHPEWVEPVKSAIEDDFEEIFKKLSEEVKQLSEELSDYDTILEEAQEILEGERDSDYGDPVANFGRIARIASSILDEYISPEQCVVVMMAVKLSREQYKHKRDNLVDLVAYIEILNRIKELNK